MTNTTTSPNRSLNQIMNDGDAGAVITKNKNAIIAIAIAIAVTIIGFGLYSSFADKSKTSFNSKIYNFESNALKSFNEKSDPKTLLVAFQSLYSEVGNYAGLIPVVLKTSDALIGQQKLNEALEVLTIGKQISKSEYADYFILSRLAVVYEDLGQDQKAIEVLEKMNAQSLKVFEGKNYVDLGRLYLKNGDKVKAKASFTYVVEKIKDDSEFVKIAKLYLSKL